MMRIPRLVAWVWVAAVLAGCSASDEGPDGVSGSAAIDAIDAIDIAAEDARDVAGDQGHPGATAPGPAGGSDAASGTRLGQSFSAAQRQVVRDATIELRVMDLPKASDRTRRIASAHGGFVATEDSSAERIALTLRVANAELDTALDALAELGEVTRRTLSTRDVTEETIDLAARIDSQRASVERIQGLLDQADTVGEVVQVESELTWRQAELESLQQRADALADQVALSTVQVRLDAVEPVTVAGGFGSGLATGWDALGAAGRGALLVLGAVVPFAVVLALPVGAALIWYRRWRGAARADSRVERLR